MFGLLKIEALVTYWRDNPQTLPIIQQLANKAEGEIIGLLTAFIPNDYISDLEQKMDVYRAIATANSQKTLGQIAADLVDRYGAIPSPVAQLFKVIELKHLAKSLGFSRIKPDGKQHIILETPMEEVRAHAQVYQDRSLREAQNSEMLIQLT